MIGKRIIGIVLLSAISSCSQNKPLESIVSQEAAEISIIQQDKINEQKLKEIASLFPSPNLNPVYVGDFDAFIEDKYSKTKLAAANAIKTPDYWEKLLEGFDSDLANVYPFRARGITSREKLRHFITNQNSKKELEDAIVAEVGAQVLLDGLRYERSGISPSFLPIFAYVDENSFGNHDTKITFYFGREAFQKNLVSTDNKMTFASPETVALSSYLVAKIYAEQIAKGIIVDEKISTSEREALKDSGVDILRASALIEAYQFLRQTQGRELEADFVGVVLRNNMRDSGYNRLLNLDKTTAKGKDLIIKLHQSYDSLFHGAFH